MSLAEQFSDYTHVYNEMQKISYSQPIQYVLFRRQRVKVTGDVLLLQLHLSGLCIWQSCEFCALVKLR